MKELKKEEIINQYIRSGLIRYETTLSGDYKKGNKEYPKTLKVFKYLEKNLEIAKETLPLLFEHENVEVRAIASAHCLALGICVKEAEEILKEIANNEKYGIFSFTAQMTLKVWKEGDLTIYQKDKD